MHAASPKIRVCLSVRPSMQPRVAADLFLSFLPARSAHLGMAAAAAAASDKKLEELLLVSS